MINGTPLPNIKGWNVVCYRCHNIMGQFCYSDTLNSETYIEKSVARLFLVCENLNAEN